MRSQPEVKVYLSPPTVFPGEKLRVDIELVEETETPVDAITVTLESTVFTAVGEGKNRSEATARLHAKAYRLEPQKLVPGTHRYRLEFLVPEDVPPSYGVSGDASVEHAVDVHVDIPWWPDKKARFSVPVAFRPGTPAGAVPQTFASSPEGPRRELPYVEVSLATAEVEPGDAVAGTFSLANIGGRRIRGVDVTYVELESLDQPISTLRESRRTGFRAFGATPPEDQAIEFRLFVPETATPSFGTTNLRVSSRLEVRAEVAWGSDIVFGVPLQVRPRTGAPRANAEWVAPVGRARRMVVWRYVGDRLGLVVDVEREHLVGTRGSVGVELGPAQHDGDSWLVAALTFPDLGLDLAIAPWTLRDRVALDTVVGCGDPALDERLAAHAREYPQAAAVVPSILRALAPFEQVVVTDTAARLEMRGGSQAADRVEEFAVAALAAADAIEAARRATPPPRLFAADLPAWEAAASTLRGRLDRGRMWIRDGSVGTDRVELGATWAKSGLLLGTTLHVAIDPVLDDLPGSPDDPALSPAARATWRELASRVKSLTVLPGQIEAEIDGKVADPATLLPLIELAVSLRRALAGVTGAGPFR